MRELLPLCHNSIVRVLYCTSESAPIFKIGGLGDVAGSLPKALRSLGVDIRVAMPFYDDINTQTLTIPQNPGITLKLCFGSEKRWERVDIFKANSAVPMYLFANRRYLYSYPIGSSAHYSKLVERFVFFSEAIVTWLSDISLQTGEWFPDIIHLNDWHTSLVAMLIRLHQKERRLAQVIPTLLTIHNLSYRGLQAHGLIEETEHLRSEFADKREKKHLDTLKLGIRASTRINTVSSRYAKEILTAEYGGGLNRLLGKRRGRLSGILNGIDYDVWNPRSDRLIKYRLQRGNDHPERSRMDYSLFKRQNKFYLQRSVGLPPHPDVPLFAFIGRIEPQQKGIDILIHALEDLLPQGGLQIVILGTGEAIWEDRVHKLASLHKSLLTFSDRFDEQLAHQIYAGADFILIPSKYEPCGLVQMIAMRYATIPIVRRTGGLADTVVDGKTGIVFDAYSAKTLGEAVRRGFALYFDNKALVKMRGEIVKQDFSWDRSAKEYLAVYRRILEIKN